MVEHVTNLGMNVDRHALIGRRPPIVPHALPGSISKSNANGNQKQREYDHGRDVCSGEREAMGMISEAAILLAQSLGR
jgi:hypothetical protein